MVVVWPNHRRDPRSDLSLHPQERYGDGDLDGHPTNGLHAVGGGVDHWRNPQCRWSQLGRLSEVLVSTELTQIWVTDDWRLNNHWVKHILADVCHHCHDWARPRHDAKELRAAT